MMIHHSRMSILHCRRILLNRTAARCTLHPLRNPFSTVHSRVHRSSPLPDRHHSDHGDGNNNNSSSSSSSSSVGMEGEGERTMEQVLQEMTPEDLEFILHEPRIASDGEVRQHEGQESTAPPPPAGKFFITTPIYYVNGSPHIGHLYTSVLADYWARWSAIMKRPVSGGMKYMHRNSVLQPIDLLFATGTDEHGSKVARQAEASGMSPQQFCDETSEKFRAMAQRYDIGNTHFLRTTSEEHRHTVESVWRAMEAKGDIYRGSYEGWYCEADEAFATDVVKLEDGTMVTADLHRPVEYVRESNYKFRLSKYVPMVYEWLRDNPDVIVPQQRYNEVLSMVRMKLDRMYQMSKEEIEQEEDLSISRPSTRVHWGIPVPEDDSQTIYVWLDALVNYLTVAEFSNSGDASGRFDHMWPPNLQIIGKDILKFHALYWPAFLMSLSLPLPKRLLVHSYWTVEGVKMSKSLGNVVDPMEICERYGGVDNVRYFLLREGTLANDSNFSEEMVRTRCDELADIMGNLLTRCFSKRLHPVPGEPIKLYGELMPQDTLLKAQINDLYMRAALALETRFDTREAMEHCLDILRKCNAWFDAEKPWVLARDSSNEARLNTIKYLVAECLRIVGLAMWPAMPEKMGQLLQYLGCSEENGDFTFEKMSVGVRSGDTIYGMAATPPPILFPKPQREDIHANDGGKGKQKQKQKRSKEKQE